VSHGAGSRWRRKAKSCEQYCLRAGFFSARRVGARQLRISSFGDVATPIQGEVLAAKRVRAQRRSGPSTARAKGEKRAARPSATLRAAARRRRGAGVRRALAVLKTQKRIVSLGRNVPWRIVCPAGGDRGRCDVVAYRRWHAAVPFRCGYRTRSWIKYDSCVHCRTAAYTAMNTKVHYES
jgi:hypothetical protein